jgi:hypothetical protein
MDTDPRLAALPRVYGLALRLEAVGADKALIADCLDIEVEGVGSLLLVAREKLASVIEPGKEEK